MKTLAWITQETPEPIASALRILAQEYPLVENGVGAMLRFKHGDCLSVTKDAGQIVITWNTTAAALRGVGLALADLEATNERCQFDLFGVMIDCSRNAVMTISYAKKVMRRLALAGYTMVMLYTEDTYQLPDEPHFGFLRGAYSFDEIRELDDYAAHLGLELMGCIQTLGHLATFLRSKGATDIKDTANVLMVGEDNTYALIRKMLDFWSKACRSRRIHIGMDETHDLGRGKFMDRNGWKPNTTLFLEHLRRLSAMCDDVGLKPMIWSDMFFAMASKTQDYYDTEAVISEDVKTAVPPSVDLVYWDYYHTERDIYNKMIKLHHDFNKNPVMAAGLWTWYRLIYDHQQSVPRVKPCLDACKKNGIREFFFTLWGDDGAYCNYDTALAGILWGAQAAYGSTADNTERLEAIATALHCGSYRQALIASEMNWQASHRDNGVGTLSMLLWDDPILAFAWRTLRLDDQDNWNELHNCMTQSLTHLTEYPYAIATGRLLCHKIELQQKLYVAYKNRDMPTLSQIQKQDIAALLDKLRIFAVEFRRQWLDHYKYNGMETIQVRIGGLCARYQELAQRIQELLTGTVHSLPELEVVNDCRCHPAKERYVELVAPGVF